KWVRRHPTQAAAAALAAALMLVLVLASIGAWLLAMSAEQKARDAKAAQDRAEKEEAKTLVQLRGAEVGRYALQLLQAQQELDRGRLVEAEATLGVCDKTLRHWEHAYLLRQCDKCRLVVRAHSFPVRGVGVSADGSRIVSASDDQSVKIWD